VFDQESEQVYVVPPPAIALRLATAYQTSRALIVAVKLGIPDVLRNGAMSSVDIARDTASQPEDTGSGIDVANLNRIFAPMFTTKTRGMGMGLSICKSIIDSHNGGIWVSAGVPRGSIFHLNGRCAEAIA